MRGLCSLREDCEDPEHCPEDWAFKHRSKSEELLCQLSYAIKTQLKEPKALELGDPNQSEQSLDGARPMRVDLADNN